MRQVGDARRWTLHRQVGSHSADIGRPLGILTCFPETRFEVYLELKSQLYSAFGSLAKTLTTTRCSCNPFIYVSGLETL